MLFRKCSSSKTQGLFSPCPQSHNYRKLLITFWRDPPQSQLIWWSWMCKTCWFRVVSFCWWGPWPCWGRSFCRGWCRKLFCWGWRCWKGATVPYTWMSLTGTECTSLFWAEDKWGCIGRGTFCPPIFGHWCRRRCSCLQWSGCPEYWCEAGGPTFAEQVAWPRYWMSLQAVLWRWCHWCHCQTPPCYRADIPWVIARSG